MRKVFAWIEIAAAGVLAVSAIVGYVRVQFDSTVELARQLSVTAGVYKQVVTNGKGCFEAAWKTVPYWREALAAGQNGVTGIKMTCDVCAEKIWIPQGAYYPQALIDACLLLKQIPQDFSKSCASVNKGLSKTIQMLDQTMSESEYQKTIQAFDHTITSLEAAEKSVSNIRQDIKTHSLISLIVLLALSVGLFANGMVCILETEQEK